VIIVGLLVCFGVGVVGLVLLALLLSRTGNTTAPPTQSASMSAPKTTPVVPTDEPKPTYSAPGSPLFPATTSLPTPDQIIGLTLSHDGELAGVVWQAQVPSASGRTYRSGIRLWPLANGGPTTGTDCTEARTSPSERFALAPDRSTVATLAPGAGLVVWSVASGAVQRQIRLDQLRAVPQRLAYTADSASVVLVMEEQLTTVRIADGSITTIPSRLKPTFRAQFVPSLGRLMDLAPTANYQGAELRQWPLNGEPASVACTLANVRTFTTQALAFTPDGKRCAVSHLASPQAPGCITLHDPATGQVLGTIPLDLAAKGNPYGDLALSADGEYVVGLTSNFPPHPGGQAIDLFHLPSQQRRYRLTWPRSPVPFLDVPRPVFTPDGRRLLLVQPPNRFVQVDVTTGKELP
jgi:hypothetical protein